MDIKEILTTSQQERMCASCYYCHMLGHFMRNRDSLDSALEKSSLSRQKRSNSKASNIEVT